MLAKKILSGLFLTFLISPSAFAEKKLVILPFEIISKNQDIRSFGFGVMDMLSESFSVTDEISVIDRSMMQSELRKKKILKTIDLTNIENVKKTFKADFIIKGKIEDYKDKYIISFSSYDTKNNNSSPVSQIIGSNIFDLQSKLATEILNQQKIILNEQQKDKINQISNSTEDINAYSNYIKGNSYFFLSSPESYREAIKYFDKAISFDKNYSLAISEKAEALSLIAYYSKLDGSLNNEILKESEKIFEDNPNLDNSHFHKAKSFIYYIKGDHKLSLEEAKKALSINASDPEANYLFWINQENEERQLSANDNEIKDIINSNPYFSLAYIHKSIINYKIGNQEEAINDLFKTLDFIPDNSFIYNKIGEIYLSLNKIKNAEENYRYSLQINSDNYQAYLGLGQIFLAKDQADKAIEYYNKALKINPESDYPHFLIAIVYHSQGNIENAIAEYKEAIKISPLDARYHSGLGQIYYQQEKFDQAIEEYKKSLEINKELAYAHVNLGLVYNKQKKFEDAVNEIKEALKIKSDYSYAYYNLGVIYQENGKSDEAIKAYKDAINNDENYSMAHNKLGMIYYEQGYIDEAIDEITQAIKSEPKYTNAYYNLGKIQKSQGKYQEAIQALKVSLKLNPRYKQSIEELSGVYSLLATSFYNQNKIPESIQAYKEAIKLKPDDDSTYNNLGSAYLKNGKIKDALIEFKKSILINSKNPNTHYNLGITYEKLNMKSEAKQEYKKACELGNNSACEIIKQ